MELGPATLSGRDSRLPLIALTNMLNIGRTYQPSRRSSRRGTLHFESLEDRRFLHAEVIQVPVVDGLVMRLNANAVTAINGLVTQWQDLSGRQNDLTVVRGDARVRHEALNGNDVIRLDGVDDILGTNATQNLPLGNADRTMFVVASYTSAQPSGVTYGSAANNAAFGMQMSRAGNLVIDTSGQEFSSRANANDFGWVVHAAAVQSNQIRQYVNGELVETHDHTLNTQGGSFRIGAQIDNTDRVAMDVAEVLVYNRALTAQEQQLVNRYLTDTFMPDRSNFVQETVVAASQPMDIEFLPDGRMLVAQKAGAIRIGNPNATSPSLVDYLRLPNVNAGAERGLLDIELDPQFASNGFVYAYYANANNQRFRISRFQHQGATASLSSEQVIWEHPEIFTSCCHHGGGLAFGPDGKLYLSIGDHFDGSRSMDTTSVDGKVLRLNRDGSIPGDNPFVDGPGGNFDEIYAVGLRNPFRMTHDRVHNQLLLGDVGGNDQTNAWEEVNRVVVAGNFGWPECEGDCTNPAYEDPIFAYAHEGFGAAVIGGFVHSGTGLPAGFRGRYFYGDFARRWIRGLILDVNGNAMAQSGFSTDAGLISSLAEGPDGSIYWTDLNGSVRRYVFTGDQSPPIIEQANADVTLGEAPLNVQFTARASGTGGPISYRWNFGDGTQSTLQNPTHTYTSQGDYAATLRVIDNNGASSTTIGIRVGRAPNIRIDRPLAGSDFIAGQTIDYGLVGFDPDGTLSAEDFEWTVDFIHNQHTHPVFSGVTGREGSFQIPRTGHDFSDDTGYRISVTATDQDGLQATDSIEIRPRKVDLVLRTNPTTIRLELDSIPLSTPAVYDTLVGFEHQLSAPASYCVQGVNYAFESWPNSGPATQTVVIPAQSTTITANFVAAGQCFANDPGDGIPQRPGADIVGRTSGQWWVGASSGRAFTNLAWGPWSSTAAWENIHRGDVTGDGRDDIIGRVDGVWWVAVSRGDRFDNQRWGQWSTAVNWQTVVTGDFNGDQRMDIAGRAPNGTWWVSRSDGTQFITERWGQWSNGVTWRDVLVGDFNGDQRDDILGRAGKSWWLASSAGDSFQNQRWVRWNSPNGWANIAAADVDGDGRDDLLGRKNGRWWVSRTEGTEIVTELWATWSNQVTWRDIQIADFTGDGIVDIAGRAGNTWWVARSSEHRFVTERWGTWNARVNWEDVAVGDFNRDGNADIAGCNNGTWWVAISTSQSFDNRKWGTWSQRALWQNVFVGEFTGE